MASTSTMLPVLLRITIPTPPLPVLASKAPSTLILLFQIFVYSIFAVFSLLGMPRFNKAPRLTFCAAASQPSPPQTLGPQGTSPLNN